MKTQEQIFKELKEKFPDIYLGGYYNDLSEAINNFKEKRKILLEKKIDDQYESYNNSEEKY